MTKRGIGRTSQEVHPHDSPEYVQITGEEAFWPRPGSGTHRGIGTRRTNGGFLAGIPPTGKRFEVHRIRWYRVRGGKITDHFANRGGLGIMQQLDLLPTPGR